MKQGYIRERPRFYSKTKVPTMVTVFSDFNHYVLLLSGGIQIIAQK